MTGHDLLLLAVGFNAGVDFMLLVHLAGQLADGRRDRKSLAAAEQRLAEAQRKADRAL